MICAGCPVGENRGCRGETHRRFCNLQATDTNYRDLLLRLAGLDPERPHPGPAEPVRAHRDATVIRPNGTFLTAPAAGKIRLGFLSPNLNAAGAERVQLLLLRGLDPARFILTGMVVGDPIERTDAEMTAATAAHIPIRYGLDQVADLAAHCDVVVSWMVVDLPRLLDGIATPVVYIDHFPHAGPLGPVAQACLRGSAAVVGVSPLCNPAWQEPAWKSRYRMIPNGVDASRLDLRRSRAAMLAAWGLPADALVAGSYCRIHLDRRPDAVVRALALLPEPWHAVVVGEPSSADEVQHLANLISQWPADVQARVRILPADAAAGDVLNAFDVVVSAPSGATESFGLTAAEAAWLSRPVVATPFGLPALYPQFFDPVELDDTAANLAAAVLAAHAGGSKPGARDFVRQHYAPAVFLAAWTKLLHGLARPARPSVRGLAGNFARAVVRHAADGFVAADPAVQEARMVACRACPNFVAESERCRLCGCFMALKKAWRSERCPVGRWEQ